MNVPPPDTTPESVTSAVKVFPETFPVPETKTPGIGTPDASWFATSIEVVPSAFSTYVALTETVTGTGSVSKVVESRHIKDCFT